MIIKRSFLIVCLSIIFTFAVTLYSTIALAAIIHVPADQPTIQAGIDVASPGDVVLVADDTYTGAGNKDLDFNGKAITVQSENGPANCFIDCEGVGRGFDFHSGEGQDSVLSGFTIKNSEVAYDAIVCFNSSSPTITNCIIAGNGGSGIFCGDNSSPTITNCTISNNTADYGGGIHCYNASPTITNCTITGNTTIYSGAIHCAENSSLTITNCSVTDNIGGAINCYDSPSLTITNCTITDNTGGGIICYNSPSLNISDSIIARNSQRGIQVANSSSATISGCTITGNTTEWGGAGIECVNSSPTVTNCIISDNTATLDGAGIRCRENSSPTITNCTISNNTASGSGGGIHVQDNSSPAVTNSILWADSPDEISIDTGVLAITYSDIEGGWAGTGNINADPLFVGSGDYHLTASSPCIDAGTSEGAPDTDIDGNPRPQVAGYDMGADEYVGWPPIIEPSQGTIGIEIIITGENFGVKKGKVAIGSMKCKVLEWTNTFIRGLIKKVPRTMGPATYDMTIKAKGKGTEPIVLPNAFSIMGPTITAINPASGFPKDQITITGSFFGTKKVKAFMDDGIGGKAKKGKVISLTMDSNTGASTLVILVPKKLAPGLYNVAVTNKVGEDTLVGGFTIQ